MESSVKEVVDVRPEANGKLNVPLDLVKPLTVPTDSAALKKVERLDNEAKLRWKHKLVVESALSRSLVSFQSNKTRAVYRWFKYKEAFSAGLLEYLHERYQIGGGALLDPFAGSG